MTRSQRNGIIGISVARLLYITERIETDKWSSQTLNIVKTLNFVTRIDNVLSATVHS
jgi:hypothetical protein